MMEKARVNGKDADAVWYHLRENSELKGSEIPWNFSKFLVDADGKVVKYWKPEADHNDIISYLKELLKVN